MSTATQQTEVRTVYITCQLGKSELSRLFNLAPEGIPAAAVTIPLSSAVRRHIRVCRSVSAQVTVFRCMRVA
ncbi:hypothetical protein DDQ41_04745 [Streptomyces spongiicola]|uniref:Uncharacterized protein n=1 Tax=Streptomyces spongiicola TaxID=1690221 RepID=A0ABM6V2M3_9ACTN|nr:hypothetical protein [Streptomyces spongiicola]AWK08354.1 hypothetical protein DDQ41_04745 [Streptomyces spongiicola]